MNPLEPEDKQKLADQYNQKLLDDLERLAQNKNKRPVLEEPRVNKFNRNSRPSS